MKIELLTVKELVAELRMSIKTIQRAYRKGDIPVQWLCRMARFDLSQVRQAMERNGQGRVVRLTSNSGQTVRDRRQSPASRQDNAPDR